MRRIRLTIEAESMIQIDEKKMDEYFDDGKNRSAQQTEHAIEKIIVEGDGNRDSIARIFGTEDGYEKHHDTIVHAEIEEHCEKHDWWYPVNPKAQANCWMCKNESRAKLPDKEPDASAA